MFNDKYIILRSQSTRTPSFESLGTTRGFPFPQTMEMDDAVIEIEETVLNKKQAHDLRRDPRTQAIAPPMPMMLIEPVSESDDDSADDSENGATWGVNAVKATQSDFDGSGITVAVLDTGIDPDHPAFAGVDLVQRNFTQGADNDENSHGTHCAGTIFGKDVDGTRIGIARNIKRALIGKVLGEGGGSSATIAQAIQWAVGEGANVISMSLGIDFPGYVDFLVNNRNLEVNPATSLALEAYRANINLFSQLSALVKAQGVFGEGTIIVAASGNESRRPEYEIAVAPPAAGTGIIAVGALQNDSGGLSIASFSNNQVDISAPGAGIISSVPGGGLGTKSGTSMATPHVAGIAALWAQRQLQSAGRIKESVLAARLIASGTMGPLADGIEAEDAGTGLVQAPLA